MALQDFIQKLKEQEDNDVVYSKAPEPAINIIPPEHPANQSVQLKKPEAQKNIKIIPPESDFDEDKKPKTIKFKLNLNHQTVEKTVPTLEKPVEKPVLKQQDKPKVEPKPKLTKEEIEQAKAEEMFRKSGTAQSKRALWFEYYEKAKSSRKKNSVVERLKIGKFAITSNNEVLILPDYDVMGKSSTDILHDKWIRN